MLHLIKMWLDCPVEEADDRGRQTRTTEARDNRRGIPQGNRPGGNATGVTQFSGVLGGKRLELLHEAIPTVTKIALLEYPETAVGDTQDTQDVQAAAHRLGLEVIVLSS